MTTELASSKLATHILWIRYSPQKNTLVEGKGLWLEATCICMWIYHHPSTLLRSVPSVYVSEGLVLGSAEITQFIPEEASRLGGAFLLRILM